MAKTILLADDSPMTGQTLYGALAIEGSYDLCAQAADGSEAISLAKRYKPDLVIRDQGCFMALKCDHNGTDFDRCLSLI